MFYRFNDYFVKPIYGTGFEILLVDDIISSSFFHWEFVVLY